METLTIQMTSEEYDNYKTLVDTNRELSRVCDQKQSIIESTRDMYSQEFKTRMALQSKLMKYETNLTEFLSQLRITLRLECDEATRKDLIMKLVSELEEKANGISTTG